MSSFSLAVRSHLDSELVARTATHELTNLVRAECVCLWIASDGQPVIASSSGTPPPASVLPAIRDTQASGRTRRTDDLLAVPVVAPRSGPIGVLSLHGGPWTDGEVAACQQAAVEIGYALETANLYEQAVSAREKARTVLSRVADGVVVTDAAGVIEDWNDAATWVTACPSHEALGARCENVLGLHDGERPLDCSKGCPLMGPGTDVSRGRELWRRRSDGRRQPVLISVSAVHDQDGHTVQVVHSVRDITRLKEADEAKTMFLATASHELKTPLTIIQGFAQLLLSSGEGSPLDQRKALEALEGRAVQLNKIVDRLLLSSRIEAGRAQVSVKEVDILPLIRERCATLGELTGRQVALEEGSGLEDVLADPDAVVTIVDHLLDNGVKYSPDGGPIGVSVTREEPFVAFTVTDEGIGMDSDQAARCFEKFWQAESSDVRRFGGTGIGLYIVRSLVDAMGGEILVHSAPEAGTTFTVRLPLAQVPEAVPEPDPGPGADSADGEPSVIREFMRQIGIPAGPPPPSGSGKRRRP